ncbi:hypothetical protein LUZ62_039014 [Rhynchospora pubera]|uniref:Uncharacterized protein n=1 Tax=Rhynchospora pubera TaxID=906938 RepID=A0AAV8F2Z4_9POAL|nr:hypothetical protein LUZ62_039014 [Rhynchospora pubera]
MEESRKGTAPNSSTKATSASLDEDFGKDFLTSWKSTGFGSDAMDFDVETSEGKNKGKGKKFNFGKLDDFDLDADFDKLPSFKMDMSDLDFSSPVKKNTTKPSTEKYLKDSLPAGKDKEKEPFSFSFDFDDLGKFDLGSHLSIKEKETLKVQPSTSVELNINRTQKENLSTEVMDVPKVNSTNAPSKPENSSSTSRPPTTEQYTSKQPSCNLSSESDQSIRRKFSVPSISGNSKYREAQLARSHPVKGNSENKGDSSAQSLDSYSQAKRSASPVISSNNQGNVGATCSFDSGLSRKKDATASSAQNESEGNSVGVKVAGVEKDLNSIATSSASQRHLKSIPTQEKVLSSPLYEPESNSASTSKQSGDSNKRTGVLHSDSQDMERRSNIDVAHAKSTLLIAPEKARKIGVSDRIENDKPANADRTFSTLKNTKHSLPADSASLKNEKQTLVSNPLISSRLTKINQRSPSAKPGRDLTSAKLKEISKPPSQLTPASLPNPASEGKPALLSPPLKRKLVEDAVPAPCAPLKRISSTSMEPRNSPVAVLKQLVCKSPLESRRSPEIAFNSGAEMVTASENAEGFMTNQKSPNCTIQPVSGSTDFEIPVLIFENNANVEKAETISKELGDIGSMLKRKQEEAKELLVRAIVCNNKLLMLNHPMYDEKLSNLERFASSLRARHF